MIMTLLLNATVLIFKLSGISSAAEPHVQYEHALLAAIQRATTTEKLNQIKYEFDNLQSLVISCDLQLSGAYLPNNCYLEAEKAIKLGLKPRYSAVELLAFCERQAKISINKNNQVLLSLPDKCARLAADRVRLNRYRSGMDIEL